MKYIITISFLFVCNLVLLSQNQIQPQAETESVATEYKRNALSVMILDNRIGFTDEFRAASLGIVIPDKFDDNNLISRSLSAMPNSTDILNELQHQKTANEILSKWFSRDTATGIFNMKVIHDRGLYNASDNDIMQASASKVGIDKLKDAGESLINGSYILVLEFYDINTMTEIYNRRDVAKKIAAERMNKNYQPVRREKNGWVGNVRGYLYKLNFNDSIMNVFYNDLWIYENDDENTKLYKQKLFDVTDFPIEFVAQVQADADGSQYNQGHPMAAPQQLSRTQLFQKMINTGINGCVDKIEVTLESFKVKAPIYKVKPISAKVGKKEGLKTDQRYFVFETKQNNSGQVVFKRKAAVRVKKAMDNRTVATGKSNTYSTFYQVSGLHIEPGMTIYQKNDLGVGVSGGVSIGEIGGGWGKVEFNVARMASAVGDIGITQLKVFGAFGYENKEYDVLGLGTVYDMEFMRWQTGISKGFYIGPRFSLAPFIAFGAESGANSKMNYDLNLESNDFIGANFFNFGLSGNFNLLHFLQIYGCANYYLPFPYTYTNQHTIFDYGVFNNKKYTEVFEDRQGISIDLGIRLEF